MWPSLIYPTLSAPPFSVILTLRTWAVWNRDWRLSIGLPVFFGLYLGVNIPFILKFLKSLECEIETSDFEL
jgi:hypothetical protein